VGPPLQRGRKKQARHGGPISAQDYRIANVGWSIVIIVFVAQQVFIGVAAITGVET